MKVLIIGGTGFIGRHLTEELKDSCELILLHRGNQAGISELPYQSVIADRRALPTIREKLQKLQPEIVIDLIPYFAQDAWDVINTFRQISRRVIALSSGDVYRSYEIFKDNLEDIMVRSSNEEDRLRQNLFPYRNVDKENFLLENYDKILVENLLKSEKELATTILRLGAVYGAFDSQRKLKEYLAPMLNRENEIVLGEIKATWKWTRVFVKEVVKTIRLVIENEEASRNEIFNVGEKEALSQIELITKLKELSGWNGTIRINEEENKEMYNYEQHLLLNTDKIRSKLRYREKFSLEEGLKEAIDFEKSNYDN